MGENRKTCEIYIRHFLDHWAHAPGLFDEDLDAWVDNFMKPGNLQGGFDWYIGTNESRLDLIRNGPPELPKIETPTRVRWGESDRILKVEWADRLGDYFADLDFAPAREAGHFAHYERPDLANREISSFFAAVDVTDASSDPGRGAPHAACNQPPRTKIPTASRTTPTTIEAMPPTPSQRTVLPRLCPAPPPSGG